MSKDTAREMIANAWEVAKEAAGFELPIEYQNMPFKQPAEGPWGRYTLGMGETSPAALGTKGNKFERTPFFVTLQVFIPKNKGTKPAYSAEEAMKRLNYQCLRAPDGLTVVYFQTASLANIPAATDFESFNVTIQGHFDTYQTTA